MSGIAGAAALPAAAGSGGRAAVPTLSGRAGFAVNPQHSRQGEGRQQVGAAGRRGRTRITIPRRHQSPGTQPLAAFRQARASAAQHLHRGAPCASTLTGTVRSPARAVRFCTSGRSPGGLSASPYACWRDCRAGPALVVRRCVSRRPFGDAGRCYLVSCVRLWELSPGQATGSAGIFVGAAYRFGRIGGRRAILGRRPWACRSVSSPCRRTCDGQAGRSNGFHCADRVADPGKPVAPTGLQRRHGDGRRRSCRRDGVDPTAPANPTAPDRAAR